VGASADEQNTVFWVTALRFVGCTAFAPEEAVIAAGDDNSMRKTMVFVDVDQPMEALGRVARGFAPEAPLLERGAGIARFLLDRSIPRRYAQAHCESAVFFSRSLGMPEEVARALDTTGERFDGKGLRGTAAEQLPLAARVSDVADPLELFAWTGGPELASRVLRQRRGRTLDPALVDAALADLPDLLRNLGAASIWDEYLAAEPAPRQLADADIDRACVALGRFGDLKSVYTLTHSARVTALAEAAGRAAGLDDEACARLRWAGAVHDLGRVGVATGTWDKQGPLNAIEWQRVRAHSQHTEAVLRGAGLGDLADVAAAAHERGRGAGYHKGLPLEGVPFLARIIAAADVMAALGELRPHRPAMDGERAVRVMRGLVEEGALDARAVQAVLEACGTAAKRKRAWPAGLSDREVEVIKLVAVGRTNKEVGRLPGMSARTAQKHVMHVYEKLGLESRAGLALYAIEHGLLDQPA
jgi:HD-GYP domain-containing protein (c-di-GMP phosphodiesterase class II)